MSQTLNFKDAPEGGEFELLDANRYQLKLNEAGPTVSKNGNAMVKFKFTVIDDEDNTGKFKNRVLFDNILWSADWIGKLNSVVKAAQLAFSPENATIESYCKSLNDEAKALSAFIDIDNGFNRIKNYAPIDSEDMPDMEDATESNDDDMFQ